MFGSAPAPAPPAVIPSDSKSDPIVGLDVGGKVFYLRLSKLTKSGSAYFANPLKDVAYKDDAGRKVIFLDRSPQLFEHVRDYLVGNLTTELPLATRRQLRKEAEFLGLEGMTQALQVSQTFSPTSNPCQGVLYWLGTNKNATNEYENPYSTGAVEVTGWMDDDDNADEDMFDLARFARSRETFVEYRCKPAVQKGRSTNVWEMEQFSCLQWCQHANKRLPVVIDLRTDILLRPTYYSMRVSECMGLAGDWNLEGSNDGKKWEVLHAARDDNDLFLEEGNDEIKRQLTKTLSFYNDHVQSDELAANVLLQILEQDFRHTWKVDAKGKFYRYFRLIGASDPDGEDACLHGEGLELFGEVYEA